MNNYFYGAHTKLIVLSACLCLLMQGCGGGSSSSSTPPIPTPPSPAAIQKAADDAFIYGYPMTEMMRVCDLFPDVNRLHFRNTLATPQTNEVIRPNNDTFNALACLYLGADWVLVTMPALTDRYQSMQVFDAFTETAAVRGPNEVPVTGAQYVLRYSGANNSNLPDGIPVIDVATPYAFVLFRTLVDGPADAAAADAAQRMISLVTASTDVADRTAPSSTIPAQDFFLKLMFRLAQNPPPTSEENMVASFAEAGIQASLSASINGLTTEQLTAWETAYSEGLARLDSLSLGTTLGGWNFTNPNVANPGTDYILRAWIARHGLFPLSPSEAIYPGTSGDGLVGRTLHLPNTWPPVNPRGFWSLTMYTEDGFLVENEIDRYSIGDRTQGLQFESDGSLKIYIQCNDPGGSQTANWLPAPCGPFSVLMRLYLPDATAQDPNFMLPPLL